MAWGRKDKGSKEGDSADARGSIVAAFWKLLNEQYRFADLTPGVIASGAHCNKASFYYNFSSTEEVAAAALGQEFPGDAAMAQDVFKVLSGVGLDSVDDVLQTPRWEHVMLLVRQGGGEVVRTVLGVQAEDLCDQIFRPEGGELEPEAKSIAKSLASGGLTIICDYLRAPSKGVEMSLPLAYLSDITQRAFEEMCVVQGVSQQEVLDRLWRAPDDMQDPAPAPTKEDASAGAASE